MSLGSWFRDYLYIPLGGNRVSPARWYLNILIVWMATGFWHGAAWNFIVWGLWFAFFLVMEKLWLGKLLKKAKVLNHVYVLICVILSFVLFNATNIGEAVSYIGGMFGIGADGFAGGNFFYYLGSYAVPLILALFFATPVCKNAVSKFRKNEKGAKVLAYVEPVVLAALVIVMTAFLVDGSFNPFLYFRF
jgi:alginate O-acetyltransferase complex protein AlgI